MPLTRTGKETFKDSENQPKKKSKSNAPGKQHFNYPESVNNNYDRLTRRPVRNEKEFETSEDDDSNDDNDVESTVSETSNFTNKFFIMMLILVPIILLILIFNPSPNGDVVIPVEDNMKHGSGFEKCIYDLSSMFPKQDSDLWKRIVKKHKYNSEHKHSVMCQTLTTHLSNLKAVDCLVKKLSNCLGEPVPYTFTLSKDFDVSASNLERELNVSFISVGYFENISDYLYPLPFVFQSICDPDHSPYKEKTFFFTVITDHIAPQSITHRYVSKLITETLVESWVNDKTISLSEEETIAIISRISDISYYIRQEDENIACE